MSDTELFRELVSGGDAGFAVFHERLSTALFFSIRHILWDAQEAEDALQDAFMQMWKSSSRFDPARGTLFSWAVTIARHKALDRLRRARRHQRIWEVMTADGSAEEPQFEKFPDTSLVEADERNRLLVALALLSRRKREAIELAFFDGMTHVEISQKCQVPLGTIKARIRRGLLTLRHELPAEERTTRDGVRLLQAA